MALVAVMVELSVSVFISYSYINNVVEPSSLMLHIRTYTPLKLIR